MSRETRTTRIAVVVASRGRPDALAQLLDALRGQTETASQIVLSVTSEADLPALDASVEVVLGAAGSCVQRNRGLACMRADMELVAFFDDDYVPASDALEGCARLFARRPEIAAANGHLLADGINGPGLSMADADRLVKEGPRPPAYEHPAEALYGCNMVFRAAAVRGLRFDERMPLNGWQEDIDFSARAAAWGPLVRSSAFVGVHRGVKGARVSGRRFGYSQIINPAYLVRKGTMPSKYAFTIACRNVAMNVRRFLHPEPWVDRRGRLAGNAIGVFDLLRGRIDPERILKV